MAVNSSGARADGGEAPAIPEKRALTYPNLGSHLDQLAAQVEEGEATAQDAAGEAPMHQGGSVAVTIYLSGNVDEVVKFLEDNGGDPRNVGEDYIEAYVPVSLLGPVSERPGVLRVREIVPPEDDFGDFTSQGVDVHLSDAWNQAGYSGQGIKVGIIDNGFEGFGSLMGTELPATVQARCYTELGRFTTNLADCENDSFHGTASAENVIDIAPEVSLYLLTGSYSWGDLRESIDWMISDGVSVINRSLGGRYQGPGDGTSPYTISHLSIIDRAVEGGIIFLNSAGNQAEVTWFQDGPPSIHDPDGDGYGFIEFAEGDVTNSVGCRSSRFPGQQLPEGREIWAYLRWEDTWTRPGASTNLDLYLVDSDSGEIIDRSEDDQLAEEWGIPTESLNIKIPRDGRYHLGVVYRGGNLPDWVQLTAPKVCLLEHRSEGYSINGPSESANPGMLAVGATHYWDTHTIADYSSRGPTPTGQDKPDIVGAACGETASYEPYLRDGNQCWFAGTSSSSPHVAGMAALVRQRFPELGPVEVAEYLKGHAVQRATPDPNYVWGSGFAQLPPPLPPRPPIISSPVTTGPDFFTVEWSAQPADNREPATSYDLRYIDSSLNQEVDANWTIMENVGTSGAHRQMVTGLTGSTQYRFQARGVNVWGPGQWSVAAAVTTAPPVAPGPPTGLTANRSDDGTQVTLSWTAPESNGGSPITEYRVESSDDGNDPWAEVYAATGDSTTYTDLGGDEHGPTFGAGMVRYYRVQAVNLVGNGPFSEPVPSGDPQLPPPAPTLSAADQVGSDWLSVSWIPSRLPGIEPSTSHDLRYIGATEYSDSSVDSDWTFVPNVGTPASHTQRITGLLGGTTYRVQVRGHNIWGMGEWSVAVDVTTRPPVVPEAPTGLTAALVPGEAKVELSWVAPTSSGGAPITGYRVELSQDNGTSWAGVYTASEGATTYTDDGTDDRGPVFEAGDGPHYRVAAINSVGTGPFSEPVPSGDPLFINYDTNRNGSIDRSEVISAISDYLSGEGAITRADVIRLINLYLSG